MKGRPRELMLAEHQILASRQSRHGSPGLAAPALPLCQIIRRCSLFEKRYQVVGPEISVLLPSSLCVPMIGSPTAHISASGLRGNMPSSVALAGSHPGFPEGRVRALITVISGKQCVQQCSRSVGDQLVAKDNHTACHRLLIWSRFRPSVPLGAARETYEICWPPN